MQLEQTLQMYEIRRGEVDRVSSYGGLYELLSGNCGGPKIKIGGNTAYIGLGGGVGVTHHEDGLGKLKYYDKESSEEYSVPLIDILNKYLKDWRIEKK